MSKVLTTQFTGPLGLSAGPIGSKDLSELFKLFHTNLVLELHGGQPSGERGKDQFSTQFGACRLVIPLQVGGQGWGRSETQLWGIVLVLQYLF